MTYRVEFGGEHFNMSLLIIGSLFCVTSLLKVLFVDLPRICIFTCIFNRRNLLAKVFLLIHCITWRFQRGSIQNSDPPPEIGVQSEILAAFSPVLEKTPHPSYKGQIHPSNLTLPGEMLTLQLLPFLFLLLLIGPLLFPIILILHSFLGLTFQCTVLLCLTLKI